MSDNKSGGIGLFGLLGVVFVTLKLCKVIDWSWWWVTAPFWGPIAILLAVLIICGSVLGIIMIYEWFSDLLTTTVEKNEHS